MLQILKPGMGKKNVEEEQGKREDEARHRQLEFERQRKINEERKREMVKVESSSLMIGNGVKSARLHEKNPRKVVLVFENGKEQIMDLNLAIRQGYVKN